MNCRLTSGDSGGGGRDGFDGCKGDVSGGGGGMAVKFVFTVVFLGEGHCKTAGAAAPNRIVERLLAAAAACMEERVPEDKGDHGAVTFARLLRLRTTMLLSAVTYILLGGDHIPGAQ